MTNDPKPQAAPLRAGSIEAGLDPRCLVRAGSPDGMAQRLSTGDADLPVINNTNRLLITAPIAQVRASFAKHVVRSSQLDRDRIRRNGIHDTRMPLEKVLRDRLNAIDEMNEEDLVRAYGFFEAYSQHRIDEIALKKAMDSLLMQKHSTSQFQTITCWLKYVFCMLWSDQCVLLPLTFRLQTFLTNGERSEILPGVLTCHLARRDRGGSGIGPCLTLASRFYDFALIDIDAYGLAVVDLLRQHEASPDGVPGLPKYYPWQPFIQCLRNWSEAGVGNGFRPSETDVRAFPYWIHQTRLGKTTLKPSDFFAIENEYRREYPKRTQKNFERRRYAAQVELIDHDDPAAARQAILRGEKSLWEVRLEAIADKVNIPEDILVYMRLLRGKGSYRPKDNQYPTRMEFFPTNVWATWNDLFEKFHLHRAQRGMEWISSWESMGYVFQDYLCCYLPWWQQMHPGINVAIPEDASEFNRFEHWVRPQSDEAAPLPLSRLFDETRHGNGRDGFNAFVADVHAFFEFCRGDAARLGLRRLDFPNPVVPKLDRMVSRRLQRTNKDPIPRGVVPYMLRYAYAVERWYLDLAGRSLAGTLTDDHRRLLSNFHRPDIGFEAAQFDIDAGFELAGRRHAIPTVPFVATWDERLVRDPVQGTRTTYLPALSALRMCVMALETGLRFQGIQWLDRRTYRSRIGAEAENAELLPLIVNTDKVKDHPWVTLVVRRAYEMLRREEAYQDLLAGSEIERLVPYEGREHTRFASVWPLFRSPRSDDPISDRTYATAWERLIIGFSLWYPLQVPAGDPLRMWRFEAEVDKLTGKPREAMHVEGTETPRRYCPLKVKLRHTPHSARSTFISARNGILPVEITGGLVGQTNTRTTYHYVVESEKEVGEKVLAASNSLWEPDPLNPVHVRADQVNSALRRSFAASRSETEANFGFQTLSLLNEENQDVDGVLRLRSTPMGRVAFRETHICPVGETCPADVLDLIVEPRRCGLCPLAVKSVDHLPSIGAKMRMLLEQVREGGSLIDLMRRRGEPDATVDEVQQRRRLDVMEHDGWRASLQSLQQSLQELGKASRERFQVGQPDAVRLHLKLVTREPGKVEFLLRRICDSAGHAAFETPLLRAQARQLRQRLLTSPQTLDAELSRHPDDPVGELLGTLRLALEARGIAPTFRAALEAVGLTDEPDPGKAGLALPPPTEG